MKYVVDGLRQFFWFEFFRFRRPLRPSSLTRVKKSCFRKHGFCMTVLETVGQERSLLNQTSLLLHQTVFQTSSNRNICILQVRMGRLPPHARVYCAVWPISKPNGILSHGLDLNAYYNYKQVEKQCGKLYVSNLKTYHTLVRSIVVPIP